MVGVDGDHRRVAIYSDDNASPMVVVPLVQHFQRRFRPTVRFSLSWAAGSIRPGPGELGGGVIVVTANAVRHLDVWTWVEELRRELAIATNVEA
jgi:hypothetical protein